jgi:hypothetical protein
MEATEKVRERRKSRIENKKVEVPHLSQVWIGTTLKKETHDFDLTKSEESTSRTKIKPL